MRVDPTGEFMSGQAIRLLDVFLVGPLMVWVGLQARSLPGPARFALMVTGGLTVLYNGRNYLANLQAPDDLG